MIKISELISALEVLKLEHGDAPVEIYKDNCEPCYSYLESVLFLGGSVELS